MSESNIFLDVKLKGLILFQKTLLHNIEKFLKGGYFPIIFGIGILLSNHNYDRF